MTKKVSRKKYIRNRIRETGKGKKREKKDSNNKILPNQSLLQVEDLPLEVEDPKKPLLNQLKFFGVFLGGNFEY